MADGPVPSSDAFPSRNQRTAASPTPRNVTVAVLDGLTSADESCPEVADLDTPAPASAVGPFSTAPPEALAPSDAASSASPPVQSLKIALLLSSGPRNTFTISKGPSLHPGLHLSRIGARPDDLSVLPR